MLKKIDQGALFLEKHVTDFRCPVCHETMKAGNRAVICASGHRFDVSKKGTLYFLDHQIKTEYTNEMFHPRGRMIEAGMYNPVMDELAQLVDYPEFVLDVGCGEGSFLTQLNKRKSLKKMIGFDISKEGVYLATQQPIDAFWCVADLTNLPFADNSVSTILNIFSPSHYKEFQRVLASDGQLIKVVPQAGYLTELRQAFYPDEIEKQSYSNEAVVEKFKAEMTFIEQKRVTYTFDIPKENQLDLLSMSPLEWGVSETVKQGLKQNPLEKITIDIEILKGSHSNRFH
ncbi:50S rRNA methyltransferase [Enterococcus sp. JM4C]|uniref:methyltransferase domain-containing protein n=1 Tax=Candidatus Enterococcus huntleyi TaxID=1857217 RepID=UPI00137B3ADE|nr:methyltransferase domain-containing protein [Enterococcus sp. JM4C]KAF1296396.1 50S rRNA methyltransferase [Enterococcus sp. JM4C]